MNQSSRSEERGKTHWDIAALALGVAGGVLGSLTVFAVGHIPMELREHALLSGPFLAFVGTILLVAIFYRPLGESLRRGSLTISWGDKTISIQDIEKHFDQELESRLEALASEIEDLRERISGKPGTGERNLRPDVIDNVSSAFHIKSNELARIVVHLGTSKYKWRNQQTLAKLTGLFPDEIDELVRHAPYVIQGRGKSGNVIYRLTDSAKREIVSALPLKHQTS